MSTLKKIGLILIILGACLPVVTLPFITEFKPVPELCLTSNFFNNMGNMIVSLGSHRDRVSGYDNVNSSISIPYRYLFSLGVILVSAGFIILVLTTGKISSEG